MVRTLMDILLTNSAVSFMRQGENVIITVKTGGHISSSSFSLEELYRLTIGDKDAANYILSEALEGLHKETDFKIDRDAKLIEKLRFHLGNLNEQPDFKEETE